MMGSIFLGIDVGTSGTKVVAIREDGSISGARTITYPLHTPHPQWSEQDPEDWWAATCKAIRMLIDEGVVSAESVGAVGLTGQMHGLVCLDSGGHVLRPSILWNDQRTGAQCVAITERIGAERVIQRLGNPVLAGFTAPKIVWVRENEPDVYRHIEHILLPKDYVRYRLTGAFATDVADASGTSLFNVGNRDWDHDIAAELDIPESWLPDVSESPVLSSRISGFGARDTGLLEGTPVAAGAGDQAAQAVGAGIVSEGSVSVTIGTSGVVFAASDSFRVEPEGRLHAFCHAVPGMWHLMGVMLSAAGSFEWYVNTFGEMERLIVDERGGNLYDMITEPAASIAAGSEGLLFLPYLTGERTPYANPDARAVFFGLTLRHNKAHLTRSVLEGVCFGLRDSVELMRGLGIDLSDVRISGGGAESALWRQILADVLGVELKGSAAREGAAYGAALLAATGAGAFASVREASGSQPQTAGITEPGAAAADYDKAYLRFRALYPAVVEEFARI